MCFICGDTFSEKKSMQKHVDSVHEKKRPYMCPICSQTFPENRNLKRHIQAVHEKLKPHMCNICGKRFFDKEKLRNHILCVHEGIKDVYKKKTPAEREMGGQGGHPHLQLPTPSQFFKDMEHGKTDYGKTDYGKTDLTHPRHD